MLTITANYSFLFVQFTHCPGKPGHNVLWESKKENFVVDISMPVCNNRNVRLVRLYECGDRHKLCLKSAMLICVYIHSSLIQANKNSKLLTIPETATRNSAHMKNVCVCVCLMDPKPLPVSNYTAKFTLYHVHKASQSTMHCTWA